MCFGFDGSRGSRFCFVGSGTGSVFFSSTNGLGAVGGVSLDYFLVFLELVLDLRIFYKNNNEEIFFGNCIQKNKMRELFS